MVAVVICAGSFALFGTTDTIGALVVILVVLVPIFSASRSQRLRVAAWVFSVYPALFLASLYATWFTAWFVLGHRPSAWLDDPKSISALVDVPYMSTRLLFEGFLLAIIICTIINIAQLVLNLWLRGARSLKIVEPLLIPLFFWLTLAAIARWNLFDFDRIIGWFLD
jgi:hypothetical protein